MKRLYLYIDDIRPIPTNNEYNVVCARTYKEAIKIINANINNLFIIDFDHDLGGKKTGYDIAKYLVANNIEFDTCIIHSANPVGRINIARSIEYICEKVIIQ